jgi:hypothetical protein
MDRKVLPEPGDEIGQRLREAMNTLGQAYGEVILAMGLAMNDRERLKREVRELNSLISRNGAAYSLGRMVQLFADQREKEAAEDPWAAEIIRAKGKAQ